MAYELLGNLNFIHVSAIPTLICHWNLVDIIPIYWHVKFVWVIQMLILTTLDWPDAKFEDKAYY